MHTCMFQPHSMSISPHIPPFQGLSIDADINSEDAEVVGRGQKLLEDALMRTHAMGASHMVGVLYSSLHKYPAPCSAAARKNVVKSLQVRLQSSALLPSHACTFSYMHVSVQYMPQANTATATQNITAAQHCCTGGTCQWHIFPVLLLGVCSEVYAYISHTHHTCCLKLFSI